MSVIGLAKVPADTEPVDTCEGDERCAFAHAFPFNTTNV